MTDRHSVETQVSFNDIGIKTFSILSSEKTNLAAFFSHEFLINFNNTPLKRIFNIILDCLTGAVDG